MIKRVIPACIAALTIFGNGGVAHAEDPTQTATRVLYAYEDAWSHHDAKAIAGLYAEPAIRVSVNGPIVRETQAAQTVFFNGLLTSLVNQGYERSTWDHLEVHLLDSHTAIASGVVARYRANGSVFQRQAVTYGLWDTTRGWRIFFSATHQPGSELHFR
jgi:ketosteroid isomerase-like protein